MKHKSDLVHGPEHLFNEIKAVKALGLPADEEKVVMGAIRRNAFHAHPHNIIVAMLGLLIVLNYFDSNLTNCFPAKCKIRRKGIDNKLPILLLIKQSHICLTVCPVSSLTPLSSSRSVASFPI